MKIFLQNNWYRLSIALSMLLIAFGFLIWSVKFNAASAGEPTHNRHSVNTDGTYIVTVGKNIYQVKWNDLTGIYDVRYVNSVR